MALAGSGVVRDLCVVCDAYQIAESQIPPCGQDVIMCRVRLAHNCVTCPKQHRTSFGMTEIDVFCRTSIWESVAETDWQTTFNNAASDSCNGSWMSASKSACRKLSESDKMRGYVTAYCVRAERVKALSLRMPIWLMSLYLTFKVFMFLTTNSWWHYRHLYLSAFFDSVHCVETLFSAGAVCHEFWIIWEITAILYGWVFMFVGARFVFGAHRFARVQVLYRGAIGADGKVPSAAPNPFAARLITEFDVRPVVSWAKVAWARAHQLLAYIRPRAPRDRLPLYGRDGVDFDYAPLPAEPEAAWAVPPPVASSVGVSPLPPERRDAAPQETCEAAPTTPPPPAPDRVTPSDAPSSPVASAGGDEVSDTSDGPPGLEWVGFGEAQDAPTPVPPSPSSRATTPEPPSPRSQLRAEVDDLVLRMTLSGFPAEPPADVRVYPNTHVEASPVVQQVVAESRAACKTAEGQAAWLDENSEVSKLAQHALAESATRRAVPDAPERTHVMDCIENDANLELAHAPPYVKGGVGVDGPTFGLPACHPSTFENALRGLFGRQQRNGDYLPPGLTVDAKRTLERLATSMCSARIRKDRKGETTPRYLRMSAFTHKDGTTPYGIFSEDRILDAASRVCNLVDFKAGKWTDQRFYDCWHEALVKDYPESLVIQVKQEVYKFKRLVDGSLKAKDPRIIVNCGGENQVRSLLLITIFEVLLWEHERYELVDDDGEHKFASLPRHKDPATAGHFTEHIKGMPKTHAAMKVRDAVRNQWCDEGDKSVLVEGDGSNWDFTVRPDLLNHFENVIFDWIFAVLRKFEIPGWQIAVHDIELRHQEIMKLTFKVKPHEKAAGAENLRLKIVASRRSGDRATSSANYIVNKTLWTLAYFDETETIRLLCSRRPDGTRPLVGTDRWKQRRSFLLFCEGDDMIAKTSVPDDSCRDARTQALTAYWKAMGFVMDFEEKEDGGGSPVTFAGILYSNKTPPKRKIVGDKTKLISQFGDVWLPDPRRMMQKVGTTTCAAAIDAGRAGDLKRMRSLAADKYVAYACLLKQFPSLAQFCLNAARARMDEAAMDRPLSGEYHYSVLGARVSDPARLGELLRACEVNAGLVDLDLESRRLAQVGLDLTVAQLCELSTVPHVGTVNAAFRTALPDCLRP